MDARHLITELEGGGMKMHAMRRLYNSMLSDGSGVSGADFIKKLEAGAGEKMLDLRRTYNALRGGMNSEEAKGEDDCRAAARKARNILSGYLGDDVRDGGGGMEEATVELPSLPASAAKVGAGDGDDVGSDKDDDGSGVVRNVGSNDAAANDEEAAAVDANDENDEEAAPAAGTRRSRRVPRSGSQPQVSQEVMNARGSSGRALGGGKRKKWSLFSW